MIFQESAEIEAVTPITAGIANEEIAKKFRAEQLNGDGKPEGTRDSLARCAIMLDEYAPDLFPANEQGQVHFARAIMESVADEIRAFLHEISPGFEGEIPNRRRFEDELTCLLNKYSKENGSNTPDFILAEYLIKCLETWNQFIVAREDWYGHRRNQAEQQSVSDLAASGGIVDAP